MPGAWSDPLVVAVQAPIRLSLRHKTDDHLWFTFFHEAGHILLHGKRLTFIEGEQAGSTADEEERPTVSPRIS